MSEFLARWSRLKRGDAEAPEVTPEAPVLPAVESAAEVAAEPEFDLSLLPSLEELTTETDIKGFLHKAVPAGLRNAALKRMWALDPAIREFVGPVDYAWDFNDPAGLPGISESLTGDVSQLLARAIGAAPQQEPQTDLLAEAPQPELPIALAAPPEQQPAAPEPLAVPAETVAVRPRHGSARPV